MDKLTSLYRHEIEVNQKLRVIEWEMKRVEINRKMTRWFNLRRGIFHQTLEWMKLGIRYKENGIFWHIMKLKAKHRLTWWWILKNETS